MALAAQEVREREQFVLLDEQPWSDTGSAPLGSEQFAQPLSGYLDAVKESEPSYLRAVNAIGDLPEDELPDWYPALRQGRLLGSRVVRASVRLVKRDRRFEPDRGLCG